MTEKRLVCVSSELITDEGYLHRSRQHWDQLRALVAAHGHPPGGDHCLRGDYQSVWTDHPRVLAYSCCGEPLFVHIECDRWLQSGSCVECGRGGLWPRIRAAARRIRRRNR